MHNKIKILTIVNNLGAVAEIRIISPLNYLKINGYIEYEVVSLSEEKTNPINYVPDIVILQRINNLVYYDFIKLLKSKGSKIVFELDDNLLELPEKNPAYDLYADANLRRSFLEFIWLADHLIVSTENLKEYYSEYCKSITVVPNQIDEEIFYNKKVKKTDKNNIRIGFAGTTTHREDFYQVEPALKELQLKYNDKIKLVFINMIPDLFVTDRSVEFIQGTGSLKKFAPKLIEANFDIGLAPLTFNKFNMAKSDIKFLEYGISGISGIYSNFGPYKRTIENNETGLLVNQENSEGWFSKLSYLIDNPSEIDRIKQNAFNYVTENRTLNTYYENWLNVFYQITGRKLKNNKKNSIEKTKIENKKKQKQLKTEAKKDSITFPKASIILLTHNQKKYTKECIDSIFEKSSNNFEVIIIDNNSTDDTKKYLEDLHLKNNNVQVVYNSQNVGFPAGINQGILKSKGKFVIIANNDIVVTDNWLTRMMDVAESEDKIGIVGPISNGVSGVQMDKDAKYNSIKEMHQYAKEVSSRNSGKVEEFPRVAFLCTLIKREVIDKIGGLDERFSPGNFEDDDFCLRAQLAGFKTVIAKDVFIHHYGSVSFKQNGVNKYAERLQINEKIFIDKWGSNPEGIWLRGEKYNKRSTMFPIEKDLFVQSIARAFISIDDEEYGIALENLKIALDNFENSSRNGYEKITKEDLLNMAGNLALSKNELEEAKSFFELELEKTPESSTACFGLGEVFNKAEMLQESKSMFEWASVNDDQNQNAKIRLKEVNQKLNFSEDHNSLLVEENSVRVE